MDYLELTKWVEEAGVSELHATSLMRSLQRITSRRKLSLPLPSEYRTMKGNILGKCSHRMTPVFKVAMNNPEEMFPYNWNRMKPLKLVHVNLVNVVAGMLLDKQLIGNYFLYIVIATI